MENETALLLIIFNRPDFTTQLYNRLKVLKPTKLYIVSDGGRTNNEQLMIEASRKVFKDVEWPCTIKLNYSDCNLGLRKRIVSGIDWAFGMEEKLIILEDDCIPHPDFIPYCEAMLEKYKGNNKNYPYE